MAHHHSLDGSEGTIAGYLWDNPDAVRIVILAHGYGEHLGRYEHVAGALVERGAMVAGPDHLGHGRSGGERVLVRDYEHVIDDLHTLVERVTARHPGLPVVLVGHSMGGMIAARYAQRHGGELAGLVLSGPVLGSWEEATGLLALDEIPDVPLDPSTLSRDDAVGADYETDELVWHGPFKRETLEALGVELDTINHGPPLGDLPTLWLHGEEDQLVPIGPARVGVEKLGLTSVREHVYAGARHEVFNETNKDEVIATVAAFAEEVAPA